MSFIKIKLRRDTAANWTANNPILAEGEMGIELGATPKWKVGDGTTAWNSLPYGFKGDTGAPGPVGLTGATGPQGPEGPPPPLSSATPAALGTAAVGTGTTAARADHVHALPANATTSVAGLMSSTDKTKLDSVATGATANATDAALRDRATHTGTQLAATISDFATAVSSNAAVAANTAKVTNATHTGEVTGATALTIANDVVTNAKLANAATATIKGRITAAVGDPEDLTAAQARTVLNVADGATANATDAALRDRATHTGTQAHTSISGLGTAATHNTGTSGATVPLLNGANTWSGTNTYTAALDYKPASGNGYIKANKSTATNLAGFWWGNELSVNRWILATDNTTDDNLQLLRYDDAGAFLNTPLSFSSATGIPTFGAGAIFTANIAQGTSPAPNNNVLFSANITGAATAQVVEANGNVQSGVTAEANYFRTSAGTQAATFTLANMRHFVAAQGFIGAGSTVTNQIGFDATPSLIGATGLNVGFHGSIPSGTGRWNLFMNGTAANAFAGNVRIGSTAPPTVALDVTGSAAISGTLTIGTNATSAVQAGTTTGQLARWNNTAGRYEPVTLNTLTDAADDSAAATAGVAVGGLYRTGSILKTRIT